MAESMATSLQHMVESTVAAARDEERKLEQLLFAPPTEGTVVPSIDAAKADGFKKGFLIERSPNAIEVEMKKLEEAKKAIS